MQEGLLQTARGRRGHDRGIEAKRRGLAEELRGVWEQREHDREVGVLARALEGSGYDVVATALVRPWSLPRFPGELPGCPTEHCRTPDLYALDGEGRPLIVEVETEGSIGWSRTRCQMVTFPRHARTIVAVPWPFCRGMRRNLRLWGAEGVEVQPY